uniref:Putative nmda receptor-regulated protein 2 c-terminus n=1 Tax=Culex tarsalis TaxID=7177 RepID=A0A1Q3F2F7_CULTA
MDAYLKLEWSKQHRRSELRLLEYFAIDFSRYEEDILNLHINETDPVHQLGDVYTDTGGALEFPVDPRTGQEVRTLELDTTRPFRLYDRFPSGSNLNRADHQHCLAVQNRLNMRLGFETAEELEALGKFRALTGKLKKERVLFDSFVRNYFLNNLAGRKRTIDAELDGLVVGVWRSKVGRMLERRMGGGKYQLATAVLWLKYRKNEKNVGFEVASENVLELGCVRNIYTENLLHASTLRRSKRILDRYLEEYCSSTDVDDAVHVDSILKQDEDVRFVVNSGALCYLLDKACNLEQRWAIPFRIDSVGGRNVVFIEKKLQPVRMLTHERNVQAHKYLVRSFMTIVKKEGAKPEQESEPNVKIEYKAVGFDEYLQQLEVTRKPSEPVQRNVSLQLWNLQDGDDQYRFLVRTRTDCYESLRKVKFYINISIKLEYQTEFGAEQMTKSELIREWTRQRLRPNSKTLRLRINATNHIILSHHYLELKDIEEELKRLYDIEPQNLLTNLWQTLRLLMQFPPGEHLLQHDTKNAETVMILSQSPSATTLDLHQLYSTVEYERCALEEYDWVPIDTTVITKLHREHTLLPGTFPHWTQRHRLIARETLKPKPKPKPEALAKPKKKRSKAKRIRQKLKEKEKQAQKKKEKEVQQSLEQFAPYDGPTRAATTGTTTTEGTPAKQQRPAPTAIGFVKGESFDYQSYVNQANAKKDD